MTGGLHDQGGRERLADPRLAEQDLAVLQEDIRELGANLKRADPRERLPTFRLSPQIRASSRKTSRKA
ncbi:MAG: hypothetical protein ABI333_09325 [bacterium]